jgi:hypothetical protein
VRLKSGYPRVARFYYTPEIWGDKGVTAFGKLLIVVEDLYKPAPAREKSSL